MIITSNNNPKIKELLLLYSKSSERRQKRLFVVEGIRELHNCALAGYTIQSLFYAPEIVDSNLLMPIITLAALEDKNIYQVSSNVYDKIAYRAGTEGVIGVVEYFERPIEELQKIVENERDGKKEPLILVVEGVEKPGNIGAVLRTCDACGCSAVILSDCSTDLYNPNIIRSSLGGIFSQKVFTLKSQDAIEFLKQNQIAILTAQLQDSLLYYQTDMKRACAIVVGNEAKGITQIWRDNSDAKIRIPMLGILDSLNVSISAAILCYEAIRQRQI